MSYTDHKKILLVKVNPGTSKTATNENKICCCLMPVENIIEKILFGR